MIFVPGDSDFDPERSAAAYEFANRCVEEAGFSLDDITDWYHTKPPTAQQDKAYELHFDAYMHATEHPEVIDRIIAEATR